MPYPVDARFQVGRQRVGGACDRVQGSAGDGEVAGQGLGHVMAGGRGDQ